MYVLNIPTRSACTQLISIPHVCVYLRRDGLAATLQRERGLLHPSPSGAQDEALCWGAPEHQAAFSPRQPQRML